MNKREEQRLISSMIEELTTKEIEIKHNISSETVSRWCREGKILGAHKNASGEWIIPENAIESILNNIPKNKPSHAFTFYKRLINNSRVKIAGILFGAFTVIATIIGFWGDIYGFINTTDETNRQGQFYELQKAELEKIVELFSKKSESDLRNDLAFDKFVDMNYRRAVETYAHEAFDIPCTVCDKATEPGTVLLLLVKIKEIKEDTGIIIWESTEVPIPLRYVTLPPKFTQTQKQIEAMAQSPYIPSELQSYINAYSTVVNEDATLFGQILIEHYNEFPNKYKTPEDIDEVVKRNWILNLYYADFKDLKPEADKITKYLREYWNVK